MTRFTRSFLFCVTLVIVPGLLPVRTPYASDGRPDIRDLYIVAHQDDDVLFMNPNVQRSIDAGHTIMTVYLTAGACVGGDYSLGREAGVMAAYAQMAGVNDNWALLEDKPIREITLVGQPHVYLAFFRLPEGFINGIVCSTDGSNLRTLWSGDVQTSTAVDGSAAYTKDQLVAALAKLIQQFHPDLIGTLDSTGFNGTGQDPSGINMVFTYNGHCDFYDNSDHYYSAIFAEAAERAYQKPHQLQRYRGYNMGDEAANVSGQDFTRKEATFQAYAEHDSAIPQNHPPFCVDNSPPFCLYDRWQAREYPVDINNPPSKTTCSPCPPGTICRPANVLGP